MDINCASCNRKFYAPKNNVRSESSNLNDAELNGRSESPSILNQLDEFQMNCTNEWCSFTIHIKSKDPEREEKFARFKRHKTQCTEMHRQGKRFHEINENGEETFVEIEKFGLAKEVEFAQIQQEALAQKETHGQDGGHETDKEVSESSRNSEDSMDDGLSESDEDMNTS